MSDSRKEIVAECHEAAYRAYEEVGPMQYALEGPAGLVGRMLRAINAVASRPAAPRCDAVTVEVRDANELAFQLCEKWQKSKLDAYKSRTFTLDEINAFMTGVLAALALCRRERERGNRFCKNDDCPYPDCLVGGICPSQPSAAEREYDDSVSAVSSQDRGGAA